MSHSNLFNVPQDPLDKFPLLRVRRSYVFSIIAIACFSCPYWAVYIWHKPHSGPHELPLFLNLSWYLIGSWVMGRIVVALRGPAQLGYLISGFAMQFFESSTWHTSRPYVQQLAFLVVLTRAGLEISPQDLDPVTVSLGVCPIIADALSIMIASRGILQFSLLQGAALGFVMAPIGDGLVIPKMQEMKEGHHGPLPKVVFTMAPLEMVVTIFLFGLFIDFSRESESPFYVKLLVGVVVKLVGTLLFAFVMAFIFAQLSSNRQNLKIFGKSVFSGTDKEELLFLLSAILITYSLCGEPTVIPDGISEDSPIFQSELGVVTVAFFYAQLRPFQIHDIEHHLAQIWMFGALFLFTSLGANIKVESFTNFPKYIPLLLIGMFSRLLTIALLAFGFYYFGRPYRVLFSKTAAGKRNLPYEILFIWVSGLTRATLQGALSRIPGIHNIYPSDVNNHILLAGVLTLAICSSFGFLLLDSVGNWILGRTKYELHHHSVVQDADEWRHRDRVNLAIRRQSITPSVHHPRFPEFANHRTASVNNQERPPAGLRRVVSLLTSPRRKATSPISTFHNNIPLRCQELIVPTCITITHNSSTSPNAQNLNQVHDNQLQQLQQECDDNNTIELSTATSLENSMDDRMLGLLGPMRPSSQSWR